ncbi:hypothetical protein FA13DRAFT_1712357 [Coprinellus micaceus]|uniref:Uncharacterized protein n=1 Tax=Coprinellus micaceus TaxID=71717 RepID=A0A4Y7T121_COPMI|nr:hypothetical protein FA13DRAFT_1712357 [Coprinellus micaceus]
MRFISFTLRELGNEGRGWILLAALSRSRNALWVVSSASVMFPEFPGSLDVTATVLVPKSEYTNIKHEKILAKALCAAVVTACTSRSQRPLAHRCPITSILEATRISAGSPCASAALLDFRYRWFDEKDDRERPALPARCIPTHGGRQCMAGEATEFTKTVVLRKWEGMEGGYRIRGWRLEVLNGHVWAIVVEVEEEGLVEFDIQLISDISRGLRVADVTRRVEEEEAGVGRVVFTEVSFRWEVQWALSTTTMVISGSSDREASLKDSWNLGC